MTSQPLEEDKR